MSEYEKFIKLFDSVSGLEKYFTNDKDKEKRRTYYKYKGKRIIIEIHHFTGNGYIIGNYIKPYNSKYNYREYDNTISYRDMPEEEIRELIYEVMSAIEKIKK